MSEIATTEFHIGRQPIFDDRLQVVAWELLYRPSATATRAFEPGAQARFDDDAISQRVMVDAFLEMGLDRLVGTDSAFLNVGESFLLSGHLPPAPPSHLVLELLESIHPTAGALAGVERLAAEGYRIALDDFQCGPGWEPFVELADIVKLDWLELGEAGAEGQLRQLADWGFDGLLLAEKIETDADFRACRRLGFDLFQGYFLSRPQTVRGERLPADRLSVLRLVAALQDPSTQLPELERILGADATLSYRVLKLINSALFGLPQEVDSLRQTIVLLGLDRLRSWASLLALGRMDDKPVELRRMALRRARTCEQLAVAAGRPSPEAHFTVGLFSLLDAFFDLPLPELLERVPLAEEFTRALLHGEGSLGEALACARAIEDPERHEPTFAGLAPARINEAWLEALEWCRKAERELGI